MVATTMRGSMTFGRVRHEQHAGVKTLITTMRGYKQFIVLECLKEYRYLSFRKYLTKLEFK